MKFPWFKVVDLHRANHFPLTFSFIRKMNVEIRDSSVREPESNRPHTPVMVEEVAQHLNLKPGNVFLDMTFGAGGHSSALLERIPNLRILALDRDPVTIKFAEELGDRYPGRVTHLLGKFSELSELLSGINVEPNKIDGILFDLGCSSMQFDNAERGFSIGKPGPLDMRMDGGRTPNSITAADVVGYGSEKELTQIFKVYGEERRANKIARAIVQARYTFSKLVTTKELSDLVETVCGDVRHDKLNRKMHTATKIFQALRIFVNNELNELNYGIQLAHKYLKPGGRLVVISFHSLEDGIVKKCLHNQQIEGGVKPMQLKLFDCSKTFSDLEMTEPSQKLWDAAYKGVILPTDQEVFDNPRSRSAKLRSAIKVQS